MARIGRVGLRRLLLLVAAAAIPLGWYSHGVRRQMRAAEYLRDRFVAVVYENEEDGAKPPSSFRSWIASTLGRDFAFSVTTVRCGNAFLSDDECAMLSAFPRLKHLFVQHHTVTDASLKTIGGLEQLESAQFVRCAITDDGLAPLAGLRNLRILVFEGTQVRGPGLAHFRGCAMLEGLTITNSTLVPAGFTQIARLAHLRDLSLERVGATDDDICRLQDLLRLECLGLVDNPITDRSVECLLRCPQLNVFYAEGTNLSAEAIARLKRLRPNLSVYWFPK